MANQAAMSAVGRSLERLLNAAFGEPPALGVPGHVTAALAHTDDFDPHNATSIIVRPALSIFFYRVESNKTMRAAWSAVGFHDGRGHLPLDLHFLLTAWADNAEHELEILGRAMEWLEAQPILSGPLLVDAGGFQSTEAIQIVHEDLSIEAVMRTFDSLPGHYRLSVPYLARVVRLDTSRTEARPNVVTVAAGVTPDPAAPRPPLS